MKAFPIGIWNLRGLENPSAWLEVLKRLPQPEVVNMLERIIRGIVEDLYRASGGQEMDESESSEESSDPETEDQASIPTPPPTSTRQPTRERSPPPPTTASPPVAPLLPAASIRRSARARPGSTVEVLVPSQKEPPPPSASMRQPSKASEDEWVLADPKVGFLSLLYPFSALILFVVRAL